MLDNLVWTLGFIFPNMQNKICDIVCSVAKKARQKE